MVPADCQACHVPTLRTDHKLRQTADGMEETLFTISIVVCSLIVANTSTITKTTCFECASLAWGSLSLLLVYLVFGSCQKVFLPLTRAIKWLGTGTLAHLRQQEANSPRNEARETKMSSGIGIEGRMCRARDAEVVLAVWM